MCNGRSVATLARSLIRSNLIGFVCATTREVKSVCLCEGKCGKETKRHSSLSFYCCFFAPFVPGGGGGNNRMGELHQSEGEKRSGENKKSNREEKREHAKSDRHFLYAHC